MRHHDAPLRAPVVHDRHWAPDVLDSVRCSAVLLGLLLLVDLAAETFTAWRGFLWLALAALLLAVLYPARVTAGEGWLESRRLLRTQRVRTDLLVSVRCLDGVAQRLVLRDAFGDRVEIDPGVLIDNPDLWLRLAEDARRSVRGGSLLCGTTALRRITERVDRETARAVFKVSGLD
ncbi:hypothetical protein [Streptomyces sp. P17]|uniref:hypothetical protein n=1 Tax=Streptomyces sp. P17 TaxID=3074716 RepID=UPI0028F44034|nr:hypothetical protein [Streptomyces sp. P17]MDT9701388.1 hypothetical protein [Streptomyces sp. P17]